MTWPYSAFLVILATGGLWWALAWLGDYVERRHAQDHGYVSPEWLADEHRLESVRKGGLR